MEEERKYLHDFWVFLFLFSGLATDLARVREETSRSEIRDTCAVLEAETLDPGFAEVGAEGRSE